MGKLVSALDVLCIGLPPGQQRLRRIAYQIEHKQALTAAERAFIAGAFEAILSGVDLRAALGITGEPGQGRPKLTAREAERRAQPALAVEIHRAQGLSLKEAIARVAQDFHKSEATIIAYRKRDRAYVRSMLAFFKWLDVDLTAMASPTPRGDEKR